jgi:endonuclease YncB( thermonuclease family)
MLLTMSLVPSRAGARERIAGPITAEVVKTVDGDTLEVKVQIWLGQELTTNVRIRGIDAPEIKGHCPKEKEMARAAAGQLAQLAAGMVKLSNVETDKYGGRVLADVQNGDGVELAKMMLESGLVRAYAGGARGAWCGLAGLSGD